MNHDKQLAFLPPDVATIVLQKHPRMQEGKQRSDDWAFWIQVRSALYRVSALLLFMLVHKLLNVTLEWVVPRRFTNAVLLLESIAFVAFAVIYISLAVEMVVVFVPALRRRVYPRERPSEESAVEYAHPELRDREEAED